MAGFGVRGGSLAEERPRPAISTFLPATRLAGSAAVRGMPHPVAIENAPRLHRLSVVIANYNYGRFLADAIDSALALDWPDVEVVVVDDGSTDDSREIIERYRDRVTVILQANAGQREACNAGYAATSGDAVIFLDADDLLDPRAVRRIAEVWTPTVSKVQFPLRRIDASGRPLGSSFPTFRRSPSPRLIRRWIRVTSDYPTPPGSGNAYSRAFLERLMPVNGANADAAADSALLAAAPFLGDVITIVEPLADYRLHGANDSDLTADTTRFAREVTRSYLRWEFALRFTQAEAGRIDTIRTIRRSRSLLQLRVAAARLSPEGSPLPGDSRRTLLLDAITSPVGPGYQGPIRRLLIAAWCVAVLLVPSSLASRLIVSRFGHGGTD